LKQLEEPSIKEFKENKPIKSEPSTLFEKENESVLKKTTEFVPKFYFPQNSMSDKTIPEDILVKSLINVLMFKREVNDIFSINKNEDLTVLINISYSL